MQNLRKKINGTMKGVVFSGCCIAIFAAGLACVSNLNIRVNLNTTGRQVHESKIDSLKEDVKFIRDGMVTLLKGKGG